MKLLSKEPSSASPAAPNVDMLYPTTNLRFSGRGMPVGATECGGQVVVAVPRVLIGSSAEGLRIAQAVQTELDYDAQVQLWTNQVMRLSQSPIASLIPALESSDFAIFIATADDESTVRGETHAVPRDNVMLELGLAIGILGPNRTFLVAPRQIPHFKLASDLLGYEPATFDPSRIRSDRDIPSVIASAVNRVRDAMRSGADGPHPRVRQWGFFSELARLTPSRVRRAREMDFYFIHLRRWREDNADSLRVALTDPGTHARVYLPDLEVTTLQDSLQAQFSDGTFLPSLVREGFQFWYQLQQEANGTLEVFLFGQHPTYTTYRIDEFVLTAMYPATNRKRNVPAFVHDAGDAY